MSGVCAFCRLPLAGPTPSHAAYCCSGCRFAAGLVGAGGDEGLNRWALARLAIAVFLSMNVMVFTMALWAQDLADSRTELEATLGSLFRYLALLFSLPVLWLLGGPLATGAIAALRNRRFSTDLLLLAGVIAAFALSALAVMRDDGPVYFEVACAVLVLVTLGRWVEATGKQRAGEAIHSLEKLLPDRVCRWSPNGEEVVSSLDIVAGDVLHLRSGERLACDGILERHAAAFDEQMLTGESRPAVKEVGDPVRAGCLTVDGDAWVTVTSAAASSTAAKFVALVRQSLDARGGYERLAERVAAWFLPLVIVVALATAAYHSWTRGLAAGALAGLAVVLIACPCALGVATPLAVWAAVSRAARFGVLFRTPEALERLAVVRAVCFDKTGTLTTGRAAITAVRSASEETVEQMIAESAALAAASTHPYSQSIVEEAAERGIAPAALTERVHSIAGRGLTGAAEMAIALGSPEYLSALGFTWPESCWRKCQRDIEAGAPVVAFGRAGQVRGYFVMSEQLRPEAADAVAALRRRGLDVEVLSGDHPARAAVIGRELGVIAHGGLSPEDKIAAVRAARSKFGSVAMVGDGLNDAAALTTADAGIALGCGADLTRDVADVCLLGNDLGVVADAIALARQTRKTIRQNLFWALAYNAAGIGLAATGLLNPIWAAAAMVISSFSVLGNSLRLAAIGDVDVRNAASVDAAPAGVTP